MGLDDLDDLLGELLDEDEGSDEDVGVRDIGLELLHGVLVPQLLEQITYALYGHVLASGIDPLDGGRHGGLVLGLEDDVDYLVGRTSGWILRDNATGLRVGCCESHWP